MRGSFSNKKNRYKKLAWVIIIMFLCGLSFIPKTKVKADDNIIIYNDEIKILEIEPGNQYRLTNNANNTPRKEVIGAVGGVDIGQTKVNITHITMAEFISMVDEVNGQYDVVVIGRKNDGLDSTYSDSKQYRDYINPASQLMKGLRYSRGGAGSNFTGAKNPDSLADGRSYVEYYSENDITEKRAKEIQAMIQSNQLVYMEDSIFNGTGDKDITKTNLYKIFNPYNNIPQEYTNFKNVSYSNINLKDIITSYKGLSSEAKRPQITKVTKPQDDKIEDIASVYNRNMKFKLNVSSAQAETLKVKIYLDINADGLFKEMELYKTEDIQVSEQTSEYEVSCDLDKGFIGYLDWKVEVIREKEVVKGTEKVISEVKSNVVSNSQFKSLDGKRNIRILQVTPVHSSGNLYLNNDINDANRKFNYLLQGKDVNGNTVQNNNVTDYNFKIDCMRYDTFNSKVADGTLKLNGNYDMVIIGFSDNYGDNEFSAAAIKELDSFVATGQSVMFTHDTMSMNSINNLDINAGPKELTQHFRDYLGQSIFKDPLRLGDSDKTTLQKEINEKDIYKDVIITRDNDGKIINYELKDKNIIHKDFQQQYGVGLGNYSEEQKNKLYSMGTTLRSITFDTTYDTAVKKINGAQISEYPYELGTTNDDGDNNKDTFNVAKTHTQWYQINLEDPDVVPWYNLNSSKISSKFDDGDSKNYYYTYSRGNLTYSGTGHSNGYTEEEYKLFINTMVKAERGANHAPEIKCNIPKENTDDKNETTNDVIAGGKHSFTVDADDLEHEIVDMHVTIDGQELTSANIKKELKNRGGEDTNTKNNQIFTIDTTANDRKAIQIEMPDSKLQNVNDKTVIKIDATDVQGAKSQKNYILKAIKAPNFQLNVNLTTLTTVDQNDQNIEQPTRNGNSIKVEKTNRIKTGYTIVPQSLQYGDAVNNMQKEVTILIDMSMTDKNQQFTQSKNGIRNSILGKYLSQDITNERDDVKIDLITYGDTVNEQYVDSQAKDQNGYLLNYRDQLQQKLDAIKPNNSKQRKLGEALAKAVDFFDSNGQDNSGKTIIIISSGDPTDAISEKYLQKIKENNYNVITLAVDDSSKDGNLYPLLWDWHNKLGGLQTDYYLSKPDNAATQQWTHNKIESDIIPEISKTLASFKYRTYNIKDVNLNFNVGDDIDLDKPPIPKEKKYIKNIPNIKYIAKEQGEGDQKKLVYYGYFQDGTSKDDITSYETDFIIKPNQESNIRERVFKEYNLTYTDVINTPKEIQLTTPILIVDSTVVDHGVYKGLKEGKAEYLFDEIINKAEDNKFAKGSVVTFGANITSFNNTTTILKVNIDPNATFSEKPKAYKVKDSSNLELLGEFHLSDTPGIFEFKVSDSKSEINNNDRIIVLYSIKLSETNNNEFYENRVSADGTYKSVEIYSKVDEGLPELF